MFVFSSISDLFKHLQTVSNNDDKLHTFKISSEISTIKVDAIKGHCYFSIKDADNSKIDCMMWKSNYERMNHDFKKGEKVTIVGKMNFYAPFGSMRIEVTNMVPQGQGTIVASVEELKRKLYAEGLLDSAHKKKLPKFPRRIGVITSPTGAAIHDIIKQLNLHNPHYDLLLYPANVQGANCAPSNIAGIDYFEHNNMVDVIIISRGGGSEDELFMYNDEALARRVYNCTIPIISAVGHDINMSIIDYVADMQCSTPTSIAQNVIANYKEEETKINNARQSLAFAINAYISRQKSKVEYLKNHKALHSPTYTLSVRKEQLNSIKNALKANIDKKLVNEKNNNLRIIDSLQMLGPTNVLKRGFSYVSANGNTIESVSQLQSGTDVEISFHDGKATATINEIINSEVK